MNLTENIEGKYLYKYLPFNLYSIQNLLHHEFWLSQPDLLNDPFEGDFIIGNFDEIYTEEFLKVLFNLSESTEYSRYANKKLKEILDNRNIFSIRLFDFLSNYITKNYGTTSFSKNCTLLKMWSHYSDSHKGFIIIYDKKKIEESISNKNLKLIDVTYNGLPELKLDFNSKKIFFKDDRLLLTGKFNEWSSEEEVRLIKKVDIESSRDRIQEYPVDSILGIIYGCRMTDENIRTIDKILISKEFKIEYYYAIMNNERNKMLFIT
jgi:hypothetical protein